MQFVDLAAAVGILNFPHPLLARHKHLHGIFGWLLFGEIDLSAPGKEDKHDEEGCNGPRQFERSRAFNLRGHRVTPGAVSPGEENDAREYQDRHHPGDQGEKQVEAVNGM